MPSYNSVEIMDWFLRVFFAQGVIFILFIVGLISFSLPMTDQVRPYLFIAAIYYWAIYRPTLLHPFSVFCFGFVMDVVMALPLAGHSLLFVLVQWGIKNQRSFLLGQTYLVVWIGFIITCLSVSCIEWLFYSAVLKSWVSIFPLLWSTIITIFIFPFINILFIGVHRVLPVSPNAHF